MAIDSTNLLLQTVHENKLTNQPHSPQSVSSQKNQVYCYCHHPQLTKMFIGYYIMLALIALSLPSTLYTSPVLSPDLCNAIHKIDAVAKASFPTGLEKLFITSGNQYWLVDPETGIPNSNSSQLLPFNFMPDVAIEKDTTDCSYGSKSIFLIQFVKDRIDDSIKWFGLTGLLDQDNIIWDSTITQLAVCEPFKKSCIIKDKYLTMARFNFKKKLDAAFGVIGEVAYFIQGEKMSKIFYKKKCVNDNPSKDTSGYDPVTIPTDQITAAYLSERAGDNLTIVLFDHDIHVNVTKTDFERITFADKDLDLSLWGDISSSLFKTCPMINLSWLSTIFSGSGSRLSRRYQLISLFGIFGILVLIVGFAIIFIKLRRLPRHSVRPRAEKHDVVVASVEMETTPITTGNKIATINGNETEKKLLQTSC